MTQTHTTQQPQFPRRSNRRKKIAIAIGAVVVIGCSLTAWRVFAKRPGIDQNQAVKIVMSDKFAQLPPEEQRTILAEHGAIGMAYGAGDYAHDIRLACHGLDKEDNDFVVGLIGKDLYPLSSIVQTMRKTQQTALYLEHLGPFFVGRAVWQSQL